MNTSIGYYFLSNDRVLELTKAFLNSFRMHNPEAPLCLIPYNDDCSGVAALSKRYGFDVFSDITALERCDDISLQFCGSVDGSYRKLAMWDGEFEEFCYIDVDTVLLSSPDFVFPLLRDHPCLTSHSNIPGIRKFVWKQSIYRAGALDVDQIDFSANTGFVASCRTFLDLDRIEGKLDAALAVKNHMALYFQEQPLLNYLIVTAGQPYTSLFQLYWGQGVTEGIMLEHWAGTRKGRIRDGQLVGTPAPVFLVHWAGVWHPRPAEKCWHRLKQRLGWAASDLELDMSMRMPLKTLWKYYRSLDYNSQADN